MQGNRLFQIIYLLLERGEMTASQLAERFEVSTRTIYRDVEAPLPSGDPHLLHQREGGGFGFAARFCIGQVPPDQGGAKRHPLRLAELAGHRRYGQPRILSRLGSLFGDSAANWIDVDFSSCSGPVERERFASAAAGHRLPEGAPPSHCGMSGQRTQRRVEQ